MKPGSVIVDLAASGGGNCESTVPGEKIVTDNGVTIIGYTDLTSRMPAHTSQLYGTNIVNLLKLLTPGKDGQLVARHGRHRPAVDHRHPRTARPCGRRRRCRSPPRRRPVAEAPVRARADRGRSWPSRPGASSSAVTRCSGSPRSRSGCRDHVLAAAASWVLHGVRAGGVRRVLRDHQRQRVAAHPADGPDERHLRDHPGRRAAAAGQHQHAWSSCWPSSPRPSPRSTSSAASASPAG